MRIYAVVQNIGEESSYRIIRSFLLESKATDHLKSILDKQDKLVMCDVKLTKIAMKWGEDNPSPNSFDFFSQDKNVREECHQECAEHWNKKMDYIKQKQRELAEEAGVFPHEIDVFMKTGPQVYRIMKINAEE